MLSTTRAEPKTTMKQTPARPSARREDLTARLIGRFGDLLAGGKLAAGMKLPPERELSKIFGVSRNSLRQALKVLQVMGLVNQRTGYGTYLSAEPAEILREPMRFLLLVDPVSSAELLEMRLMMEPEQAGDDLKRLMEADVDFHRTVYRAAGNRMSETIFCVIHHALIGSIIRTSRLATAGFVASLHRPIYKAIFARNAQQAREAMLRHLHEAQKVIQYAAPAQTADGPPKFRPIER
jgi:GntR family transcriptional repressor for pyruvate dehydrogenase complex